MVNSIKNYLKTNYLLLILLFIAFYLRFAYPTPVCWHPDSVKYLVPLAIIQSGNFDWILSTINFSLLSKVINYIVQINNNGDPSGVIVYQKFIAVISTLLFYLIALRVSAKNKLWSFIFTLIFTMNPLMLFFEQTIMPESLFIFWALLLSFLFIKFTEKENYPYAICFALTLGLMTYTKDSSLLYSTLIFLALIIWSGLKFFKTKNLKPILLTSLIILITLATKLPMQIYNQNKFGEFTFNKFYTNGVLLWFLSEEMLLENPSDKHKWLTYYILMANQACREKYKVPLGQTSRIAFECAITEVNVAARENHLVNPFTGVPVTQEYWNEITPEYYKDTLFRNPKRSWEAFLYNANIMLFKNNFYFYPYRKSDRPGTQYEGVIFTQAPFALNKMVDPLLQNCKVITTENMDEHNIYTDASRNQIIQGYIPFMVNRDTNQAFLYPEKGLSLWLQSNCRTLPWMRIILPVFLSAVFFFLGRIDRWAKNPDFLIVLYLLGSALLFLLLPSIIHGEARYQLQFTHYMLLFILAAFFRSRPN
ncbi:MAG: hypothetical protein LW817_02010 [Candidatus Caenarcaniphilales bacterium]|jgi:hypothetical protein|nr:hypothetical protein [Candidatus Caenarcaniphilales bacterium]